MNAVQPSNGAIVVAVATPQEKVLQAAPGWTEEQARRALFAAAHDPAPDGHIVDRWGDLSEMTDAAEADVLADLDADDEAAGVEPWTP
jgi:hypothetical protein